MNGPDRRLDLRLLGPSLAAWGVLAVAIGMPSSIRFGILLLAAAGLAAGLRGFLPRVLWLGLALVVGLMVSLVGQDAIRSAGPLPGWAAEGATVTAEVVLTADAVILEGSLGAPVVLRSARAVRVSGRGGLTEPSAYVVLSGGAGLADLPWESTVLVQGRLALSPPERKEIATLRLSGSPQVVQPAPGWATGVDQIRSALSRSVRLGPQDGRALVPALVAGDTTGVSADLREAMRDSGLAHLAAVSGANVTIVLGLVLSLCAALRLPLLARSVIAVATLVGFVALARPEPSVIRAAVMGVVGVLALSSPQRSRAAPALGFTVLATLGWDPWLARSPGFALSVVATVGLVTLAADWSRRLRGWLPPRLGLVAEPLSVTAAASLVTLPVLVAIQGTVSLVSLPANLLAAPLVPLATIGGLGAAAVTMLHEGTGIALGWLVSMPAELIARIARTWSRLPIAVVQWPAGMVGIALSLALVIAMLTLGRAGVGWARTRPAAAALLVAVIIGGTLLATALAWPPQGWQVVFCDVGQGDAAVVRTGPDRAVVIDVGPDSDQADRCLGSLGVTHVEAVILTHFHLDHVGGLASVLKGRQVDRVYVSPIHEPGAEVGRVQVAAGGIPVSDLTAGTVLGFGDVRIEVWAPTRRFAAGSVPNNGSVVVLVEHGDLSVLMAGDIEREAGADLAQRLARTPTMAAKASTLDVLKSPHHGSANLDPRLMSLISAPVAVISVGADNDYGHPSPVHLRLLEAHGTRVLRTDRNGAVAVILEGTDVGVVSERPG